MSKLHEARLKLRGELEAPPALRRFVGGWIGYLQAHPVPSGVSA